MDHQALAVFAFLATVLLRASSVVFHLSELYDARFALQYPPVYTILHCDYHKGETPPGSGCKCPSKKGGTERCDCRGRECDWVGEWRDNVLEKLKRVFFPGEKEQSRMENDVEHSEWY